MTPLAAAIIAGLLAFIAVTLCGCAGRLERIARALERHGPPAADKP